MPPILTPTSCRRFKEGWVLFFYGKFEVLGYVWDEPEKHKEYWWLD